MECGHVANATQIDLSGKEIPCCANCAPKLKAYKIKKRVVEQRKFIGGIDMILECDYYNKIVGENRFILGDCRDELYTIEDNSIDLIVTDPPYKTTSRGSTGGGGMLKSKDNLSGRVFLHNDITPEEYAPDLFRVLKNKGHCYIMCNNVNLYFMLTIFQQVGFHFIKSLIWSKGNKIMSQFYMSSFEYILFFRKGNAVKINNCGTPDIINVRNKKIKDTDGKNLHDTEKPIELMKILIENSSQKNECVLDPFSGIGSTAIASKILGRRFIAIEKDKTYYDIAKKRLRNEV